jgi:hypothetical protein
VTGDFVGAALSTGDYDNDSVADAREEGDAFGSSLA